MILSGQAVDQINYSHTLVVCFKSLQVFQDRLFIVKTADLTPHFGVKGLNAQRHAVDTAGHPNIHFLRNEIMNTAFQGQLIVICQR